MVTIFCVVAGPGSVFAVHIGITETVDDLKKQIKKENPNMMRFDADLLKLYLARDGGAWLNSNDDDIKALKRREVPDRIKNLMQEQLMLVETRKLNHDDYFGKNWKPAEEDIHVLVELPEDPKEVLHYKIRVSSSYHFVMDKEEDYDTQQNNGDDDGDQEDTASTVNGDEGQQTEADANIRIFLRVKPSKRPSGFFSRDEDSNTMKYDIPKDVAAGLINNSRTIALNGFNSTIFAYGQTGSGKTFTITGGAERYEDRGLIPRALSMIFDRMRNNASQQQILAHISYLEIYNNKGYDLLDPNHESTKFLDDLPRVAMLEDEDGNCHLRSLSMHPVTTEKDALNLLFSRRHKPRLSLETRKTGSGVVLRSKLHLVDLAGSDRAHKTGAKGQLLREAAYINTSLHYLEMVIVALHEKNTKGRTHKSMMLRDSLGGNCKTVMVTTVSPEKDQTDNDARLNEEVNPAVIIRQLKAKVASLEEELAILKGDVNEGEELKEYEIDKLRQKCLNFVNDPEPSAHLAMGEFTYTKMKACFGILKSMANAASAAAASSGGEAGTSAVPRGRLC
ncbi:Kinesin- protein 6 [Phytophthora boehmeriae]|uniref:Kinesin- protein 6 n=1 Tax=Phytophthora boehmeriae TaxID=109152 RepID=A0A8T1VG52_9STRA|nr:Kinesin- protein 6 [Phytophthora boehmeriae]